MQTSCDIAIVPLGCDLDVTNVAAVRQSIDTLIGGGCRRIIINMSGANYVDSAGMGLIMSEIARMRRLGGVISLIHVCPPVIRAFKLARVVDFAPVSGGEGPRAVPALDPAVRPMWRHALHVDPQSLSQLRERTDILLGQAALSADERFDTNLAIGEAVGNAIDHTSGEGVIVTISGYADRVVAEISDCGCGFDDVRIHTENSSWAARGRGLRLMHMLVDSVSIEPKAVGQGSVVRIVKLVGGTEKNTL